MNKSISKLVDLSDLGVKPNCLEDISTELQILLDDGMNVFIPSGIYLIKKPILIRSKNSIIKGDGKFRTIFIIPNNVPP